MKLALNLSYKGERTYLHGSDFFNLLEKKASEVTKLDDAYVKQLSFHKVANNACELHDVQPENQSTVSGKISFGSPSNPDIPEMWIVETDKPVENRYEYDEPFIEGKVVFDQEQKTTSLTGGAGYSAIEEIIVLTKALNYHLSPDVAGKWLFGRIDLNEQLAKKYEHVTLKMKRMFPNRFSISEIIADDKHIGDIQFIVGKP